MSQQQKRKKTQNMGAVNLTPFSFHPLHADCSLQAACMQETLHTAFLGLEHALQTYMHA